MDNAGELLAHIGWLAGERAMLMKEAEDHAAYRDGVLTLMDRLKKGLSRFPEMQESSDAYTDIALRVIARLEEENRHPSDAGVDCHASKRDDVHRLPG